MAPIQALQEELGFMYVCHLMRQKAQLGCHGLGLAPNSLYIGLPTKFLFNSSVSFSASLIALLADSFYVWHDHSSCIRNGLVLDHFIIMSPFKILFSSCDGFHILIHSFHSGKNIHVWVNDLSLLLPTLIWHVVVWIMRLYHTQRNNLVLPWSKQHAFISIEYTRMKS